MNDTDVRMNLQLANISYNVSKENVKKLAGWITSLPTSYNDLRLIHLHGKYSILKNSPHPRGDVVGDH
eukprot:11672477-Ditylum_brightwellii.AAC.1